MHDLFHYIKLCIHILGSNISRVGNKTRAVATPSRNKAERAALAESLEGKVASMGKPALVADAKKTPKPKKDRYPL